MVNKKAAKPKATVRKAEKKIDRKPVKVRQPPIIGLDQAVEIITALYESAGGEASLDDLSHIMKNSRKSSAFFAKLAVLRTHNLVYSDDEKVGLSSLGSSITAPLDPTEKSAALKTSFLQSEVYATVYDKFVGKILPQDEFLKNSFVEYGGRDLAEKWMEKFKDSAHFAGLLMDRGDGKYQVRESAKVSESASEMQIEKTPSGEPQEKPQLLLPGIVGAPVPKSSYQLLIEILQADMSPEEQQAVWTLITYLKKKEAGFPTQEVSLSE